MKKRVNVCESIIGCLVDKPEFDVCGLDPVTPSPLQLLLLLVIEEDRRVGFPGKVVPELDGLCDPDVLPLVGVFLEFDFFDVLDLSGDTKSRNLFIDIAVFSDVCYPSRKVTFIVSTSDAAVLYTVATQLRQCYKFFKHQ